MGSILTLKTVIQSKTPSTEMHGTILECASETNGKLTPQDTSKPALLTGMPRTEEIPRKSGRSMPCMSYVELARQNLVLPVGMLRISEAQNHYMNWCSDA